MMEQAEVEKLEDSVNGTVSYEEAEKTYRQWQINSENKVFDILGVWDDALIYQQYEYVPDVDMVFTELSVHKVNVDGSETYAIIDFSEWKAPATDPLYLSSDGKIYVMECLEESTVISEVVLRTTDESQMDELYQLADVRRLEVKAQEERASINATTTPAHAETRSEVRYRAEVMVNSPWTVLPTHKIEREGLEDVIIIPGYIMAAGDNTSVTGIPYCWGGYHGLAGERYSYPSFDSVFGMTDKTAGNINTSTGSLVDGTIGLDCVGYVMSAYDMAGTKQKSYVYLDMGEPVAFENLKQMDILAGNGHVILYGGEYGGNIVTFEAYSNIINGVEVGGKTDAYTTRSLASLSQSGYVGRNLFCENCDKAGGFSWIDSTGHVYSCSVCDYDWPEESHNTVGEFIVDSTTHSRTCSICDYKWPASSHDTNGEMTANSLTHTYVCSVCDTGWKTEKHDDVTVSIGNSTAHTYTCSTCEHSWSGAHIFKNNICTVCGRREATIMRVPTMIELDE